MNAPLITTCVPDCRTCRLSRAALWQPEWVFWLLVFGSNGNGPMGVLALGVWLQWERSNFELSTHGQRSCMLRTGIALAITLFLAGMFND